MSIEGGTRCGLAERIGGPPPRSGDSDTSGHRDMVVLKDASMEAVWSACLPWSKWSTGPGRRYLRCYTGVSGPAYTRVCDASRAANVELTVVSAGRWWSRWFRDRRYKAFRQGGRKPQGRSGRPCGDVVRPCGDAPARGPPALCPGASSRAAPASAPPPTGRCRPAASNATGPVSGRHCW
jgi:hypothetical protein